MNKKAISPILATTLIILMTIAAVAIIWPAIMPIIKRGASGISSACIGVDLTIETGGGVTCFDSANSQVKVSVSRGAGDYTLDKIQVIVYSNGDSESETIETGMPGINEQKTYTVSTTYSEAKRVAIAPIVIIGDIPETCEKTSTVDLVACT